jgi:hypothetical protein
MTMDPREILPPDGQVSGPGVNLAPRRFVIRLMNCSYHITEPCPAVHSPRPGPVQAAILASL